MPSLTDEFCTNGHNLAEVGLYKVSSWFNCRKCHRDTIARSRAKLSAMREYPYQLVTPEERRRFWAKVDLGGHGGCWTWTAATQYSSPTHRYGVILIAGTNQLSHRVSYAIVHGEIPEGVVLDHLCRNTRCVNPDHLEGVTQAENVARGISPVGKPGDRNWSRLTRTK